MECLECLGLGSMSLFRSAVGMFGDLRRQDLLGRLLRRVQRAERPVERAHLRGDARRRQVQGGWEKGGGRS